MAQVQPPAIHSSAFNDYYQDRTKRAVVTGRILNLPESVDREKLIGYSPVSILSDLQLETEIDVNADGTFTLSLPETYPAQEIWFWMNGGDDGLYYGTLLVREGVHLEIDYAKLLEQSGVQWAGGTGVTFSGPDAELTQARNVLTTKEIAKGYNTAFMSVMMERKLELAPKRARLDSINQEVVDHAKEVLANFPNEIRSYLLNDQWSNYFGAANVLYWNEEMPAEFLEAYLNHAPMTMSNSTRDYYQYFAAERNSAARSAAKSPGDSVLTAAEKQQKHLAQLNKNISGLDPARADLVYLYQSAKDPVADRRLLENALTQVTTPWVKSLLQKRYDKVVLETERLKTALKQMIPLADPADLGTDVGTLSFGADLYVVEENVTAEDLLAKLRGAFAEESLYLDFWAVWCQPCLGEMPHSTKLHAEAEGLPLDFVYLCTDSGGDQEQWKNLIAKYEVPGVHLFVPNDIHNKLMKLFSSRGYPTYVLLKADGTPVLDVERPSGLDRAKLEEMMEK